MRLSRPGGGEPVREEVEDANARVAVVHCPFLPATVEVAAAAKLMGCGYCKATVPCLLQAAVELEVLGDRI